MDPRLIFAEEKIIRNKDFDTTYALNKSLSKSIAYASNIQVIKRLNKDSSIAVILTTADFAKYVNDTKGLIISDNPQAVFYEAHNYLAKLKPNELVAERAIDETASIADTAIIHGNVKIGKNVKIGEYSIIESNTIIEDDCEIGHHVIIGANSMQRTIVNGNLIHLEYMGGVKIGSRSRIVNGAIIQKPYQAFFTEIGDNSVVSTNVVVGHGTKIGSRTLISGNAGLAGNCLVGDDVWIGGGAMISDGILIGNRAEIKLGSVVIKNVGEGETVSGYFAYSHRLNLKNQIAKWK